MKGKQPIMKKDNQQTIISLLIIFLFITTACSSISAAPITTDSQNNTENLTAEASREDSLPEGFVYLTEIIPDVILDIRYFSTHNFMQSRVDHYLAPVAIITREAAEALALANNELKTKGYIIKVFDAYRPQSATDHFIRWGQDENDISGKANFYPDLTKRQLFAEVYLGVRSAHTRGSTIDLTIVNMRTKRDVDMGSPFDFFGPISHHGSRLVTEEQANNRLILKTAMERAGFRAYEKEWWHYSLINEPFPNTFFNFPVK